MSGTSSHRERWIMLLGVVLAVTVPASLRAQSDRLSLPVGTRIRVQTTQETAPFTGTVWRITSDTLAVAVSSGNALLQLPTAHVTSIEVSDGRDRLGWGVRGAGIGVLAGGLLGAVTLGRDSQADLAAIAGFVAGAVVGAAGGALVGAIVAPERWDRIHLSGVVR
jgi:hypothetical protein